MQLSEYVITEGSGLYMDPLGFLRPYAALQDILFKQFTVLSNHPSYHGMLTLIFKRLAEKGTVPGKEGFSKEFRNMEILWGLANATQNESILNTTKYQRLLNKGRISLNDISSRDPIYYRLNYGTLGHYSSPSIFWGLLNKEGKSLIKLGPELADAFNQRGSHIFTDWLSRWSVGKSEIDLSGQDFVNFAAAYSITATPSDIERAVWKKLIRQYSDMHTKVHSLWQTPLTFEELDKFEKDADSYSGFFIHVKQIYPEVASTLHLWEMFEQLAALSQFIFDREYLVRRQDAKAFDFKTPGKVEAHVAKRAVAFSKDYLLQTGHEDAKNLFKMISASDDYESVAGAIRRHHVEHQNSKGVTAFMDDERQLVIDKVDAGSFAKLYENLNAIDPEEILQTITYRYKRDWHFRRASLYSQYSGNMK